MNIHRWLYVIAGLVGLFLIYRIGVIFTADDAALKAAEARADSLEAFSSNLVDSLRAERITSDSILEAEGAKADSATDRANENERNAQSWKRRYEGLKAGQPETPTTKAADSTIALLEGTILELRSSNFSKDIQVERLKADLANAWMAIDTLQGTVEAKNIVIDEQKKLQSKGDILAFIPNPVGRKVVSVLLCAGFGTLTAVVVPEKEGEGGVSAQGAGALVGGSCLAGTFIN
jgi:hypothetical protein